MTRLSGTRQVRPTDWELALNQRNIIIQPQILLPDFLSPVLSHMRNMRGTAKSDRYNGNFTMTYSIFYLAGTKPNMVSAGNYSRSTTGHDENKDFHINGPFSLNKSLRQYIRCSLFLQCLFRRNHDFHPLSTTTFASYEYCEKSGRYPLV